MLKKSLVFIIAFVIIILLSAPSNIFSINCISYCVSIGDLETSKNSSLTSETFSYLDSLESLSSTVKVLFYAVPPNVKVTSVTVSAESYDINKNNFNGTFSKIENFSNLTRTNLPCIYYEQGKMRKWNFVKIYYVPFVVNDKFIKVFPRVNFSIEYTSKSLGNLDLYDSVFDSIASGLFVNYAEAQTWYKKPVFKGQSEQYDFLIILSDDRLSQSVSEFVKYKEEVDGFKVKVVGLSEINEQEKGTSLELKIRNYIKEHYLGWATKYVMLIGDTRILPMCYMYPEPNETRDEDSKSRYIGRTPTDFFYSELDSNWDYDEDGLLGEYGEDTEYILDFYPDVFVGRVPFSDPDSVSKVLKNAIEYEQSGDVFRKSALLVGAMLYYAEEGTTRQDGALALSFARDNYLAPANFMVTSMFEKEGTNSSIFESDLPLTNENFSYSLKSGKYGLILLNAHGSPQYIARKYWVDNNGDGKIESGEVKWIDLLTPTDLNGYELSPSIFYSASCETAWPEKNSFAKATLSKGAAAYIGASRISYGGGTIDPILENFVKHFTVDSFGLGDSLAISLFEAPHFSVYDFVNLYDYNLYGDPSLRVNTISPSGINVFTDSINVAIYQGKTQSIVLKLFIPRGGDFLLDYYIDLEGIKCEFSKVNATDSDNVVIKISCSKNAQIGDFILRIYAKSTNGNVYGFPIHLNVIEAKFSISDLNEDGNVNEEDINILKVSFGYKEGDTNFDKRADLNGDGVINGIDLFIFFFNF